MWGKCASNSRAANSIDLAKAKKEGKQSYFFLFATKKEEQICCTFWDCCVRWEKACVTRVKAFQQTDHTTSSAWASLSPKHHLTPLTSSFTFLALFSLHTFSSNNNSNIVQIDSLWGCVKCEDPWKRTVFGRGIVSIGKGKLLFAVSCSHVVGGHRQQLPT